jgi:hypothetical protein
MQAITYQSPMKRGMSTCGATASGGREPQPAARIPSPASAAVRKTLGTQFFIGSVYPHERTIQTKYARRGVADAVDGVEALGLSRHRPRPPAGHCVVDNEGLNGGAWRISGVLSQDIFSIKTGELPKTHAVLTLVGGQVAYDAHALSRTHR